MMNTARSALVCVLLGLRLLVWIAAADAAEKQAPIDRHSLVTRHNVVLESFDPRCPLQVGNGEFAFAVDVTGLQTFQTDLGTFSQWGWHTFPNPDQLRYEETLAEYDSHGRKAKYAWPPHPVSRRVQDAIDWYRLNPHRLHLGRIGLELIRTDGAAARAEDLRGVRQSLDLWNGTITSKYLFDDRPVEVTTCCHPRLDLVAVRIRSPLLGLGRMRAFWHFPYLVYEKHKVAPSPREEDAARHSTQIARREPARVDLRRRLDADEYHVAVAWTGEAEWTAAGTHRYALVPAEGADELAFVSFYGAKPAGALPSFSDTARSAAEHWREFWQSGGAIDLSASNDSRWKELERRIVLAQYLTAVNSAGSAPPQESGLYSNSWYGKFHLEMTAWHGVHFVLWSREHLVDGWMKWFLEIGLPAARRQAKMQGYAGARWMKMIDRNALWDSPSGAGVFRMTQQGHAIYWAELMYRTQPTRQTLERYQDIVSESAEFMADFLAWDDATQRYILGPPLLSGSEATPPPATFNSTVELSYWFYGLRTAQMWRERLGMKRSPKWDEILAKLSKPPVHDGVYIDAESHRDNWRGRPAWFEAYGCMPGVEIDPAIMGRTFDRIGNRKHLQIWGCDFPMFAMTAARLGRPQQAVDLLLDESSRNDYFANGFNVAGSTPYLPAHGGLLWAAAMMAAGWDGAPQRQAPGFPDDGSWAVKWEGLRRAP